MLLTIKEGTSRLETVRATYLVKRNAMIKWQSVTLFTAADRLHSFTLLIKTKSNCQIGLCFRYHTHWFQTLEMSRVNRGLNKARNPDYFVRIRHSVSEMGDHLQPLGDPAQGQRERRESRQGEIKKKRCTFNVRI